MSPAATDLPATGAILLVGDWLEIVYVEGEIPVVADHVRDYARPVVDLFGFGIGVVGRGGVWWQWGFAGAWA